MHLGRSKHRGAGEDDEDEPLLQPPSRWRLSSQARDTLALCVVAGAIAAVVWGIYRWTNASRYIPPIYSSGTTLHQ